MWCDGWWPAQLWTRDARCSRSCAAWSKAEHSCPSWWDVAHHRELPLWHSFPGSDWFRRLPSMGGLWCCSRSRALAPALQSLGEQSCSYHLSASPGMRLSSCSDFRLHADDLVILRGRFAGSFGRSQSLWSALLLRHWTREVSGRSSPSCSHLRSVPARATFCLSSLPIATSEWSSLPHFPGAIMSIIWWTAGADCSRSVCLGFDQRACQSLSRSSSSQRVCSQALLSASNSRANASAVSPDLMALFASGVTCLAGQVAHPMRRCFASLVFTMACASPLVGLWLSMLVSLPSRSAPVLLSQPQSSLSPNRRAVISHHSVQRPDLVELAQAVLRASLNDGCAALYHSWRQRVEHSLGLLHTIRCDPRAQPQLSLPVFVYSPVCRRRTRTMVGPCAIWS